MSDLFPESECFRVILADCPWKLANFGNAKHGAARAIYRCMETEDIAAIPVDRWAADESVLLLWALWPKLEDAFFVARAWGFEEYVTGWPWVKVTPSKGELVTGIGFWVQHATEILLVFRVGSPRRRPDPPRCIGLLEAEPRTFYAPRAGRKHSKKPLELHEWIEATLPSPRLELFARAHRPGWLCYGLELGTELGPWGVREVAKPVTAGGTR
jgi:N6-adenosine-specific RNA methylase IME4